MTSSPLILICDHRGSRIASELNFLGELGFQVEESQTLRQTLARVTQDPLPVLLVLDPLNPRGSVECGAVDRARVEEPRIPVLFVAERDDEDAAVRANDAFRGGAWDLIHRDAAPEEYQLRIERLLGENLLLREMDELRHRASHDDRTDLLRPKAFQARLVEHFSAAQRHQLDLAFVLIDLDEFGAINKRHDHTVGDRLITQVGEVIRRALRTEDVAGRLGGDEFAVLLPYTKKIDAARVVNRLRDEIRKLSGRPAGANSDIKVSASLGFETFDGSDLDSLETLRNHAERALRTSKREGGDRGVYYRSLREAQEAEAEEA